MSGATHPVAVISKLLDLTPRRVFQLANEGVIPRAERGRYELVPAVRGYIRYLRDRAIGADALPDDAARASRARLVKAQAEAQEMENATNRGEMLPREDVRTAWADMAVSFRARTLSIPKKAAPQVFGVNSLPEIEAILERMIVEALDELSHADYSGSGEGDSEPQEGDGVAGEAPAEADGKPVGGPEPEAVPGEQRGARAVDHLPGGVPAGDDGRGLGPVRRDRRGHVLRAGGQDGSHQQRDRVPHPPGPGADPSGAADDRDGGDLEQGPARADAAGHARPAGAW